MNSESVLAFYDANAEDYCRTTRSVEMTTIYDRFLLNVPEGALILDAGCGSGRDSLAFLTRGYGVKAFDGSPMMARWAADYTGLDCQVLRFQDVNYKAEFDALWSCAALLHISKSEMKGVLRSLLGSLKLGGIGYFSFIEGEGERVADDGRFYNSYTVDGLRQLLADVGLTQELDCWSSLRDPDSTKRAPWLNMIVKRVV